MAPDLKKAFIRKSEIMKQTILIALLALVLISCNNQDENADIPAQTGNSDSVGATGNNPAAGTTADTTLVPQVGAPLDSTLRSRQDSSKK